MKAFLMYQGGDFDQGAPLPVHHKSLIQDLELNTLLSAMARGDKFLFDIAKTALLCGTNDISTLQYRQSILKDCLKNASIIREIYQIPIDSQANKRKRWLGILSTYPAGILSSSVEMMQMFVELLKRLRNIADEHAEKFTSEGFTTFFAMIQKELDDDYFAIIENHLKGLRFRSGVLLSANLGQGNEGTHYVLRKPHVKNPDWVKDIFNRKNPVYSFSLSDRDEAGTRAIAELRDVGINFVANALAQSADHIDSFFNMLRIEAAFYVGCLNLSETLEEMGSPISFPLPVPAHERRHSFQGLYDVCLSLTMKRKVVGNDVNADNKDLVIITGANQGGKSTFLRSIGLAQLMMQCGMFVPAEGFSANLCQNLFTHYKREEDTTMKSGKLDEELARMSLIIDQVSANSMILFNESFAATNEREGSEIARQITSALLDKRIKVFFVTHQYEFAHQFYGKGMKNAAFLRAERKTGGGRTYKLKEAEPLQTSYGIDVYRKVFDDPQKPHLPGDSLQ